MIDESQLDLFRQQADICKTLSDVKRLMIIHELRNGEKPVGQLVTGLGAPQANVSQHLAILRERGLVSTRRDGTSIFYSLTSPNIGQACDLVQGFIAERMAGSRSLAGSTKG